jgi:predicted MPP superfamily phosphohydrolase
MISMEILIFRGILQEQGYKERKMRISGKMTMRIMLFTFMVISMLISFPADTETIKNFPSWRFAVVSDTQADRSEKNKGLCINEPLLCAIAADIAREKPDFIFVSGDLVNGWFKNSGIDYATQYSAWKRAMAPVYKAGIKVYTIRGNHDDGPERVALPPLPAQFEPAPGELEKLRTAYM